MRDLPSARRAPNAACRVHKYQSHELGFALMEPPVFFQTPSPLRPSLPRRGGRPGSTCCERTCAPWVDRRSARLADGQRRDAKRVSALYARVGVARAKKFQSRMSAGRASHDYWSKGIFLRLCQAWQPAHSLSSLGRRPRRAAPPRTPTAGGAVGFDSSETRKRERRTRSGGVAG
jgi:hypothetical protein